jgi:hypothetical protein
MATVITVELVKHDGHPVYVCKVGDQASAPHRYHQWEGLRDQMRVELGLKMIVVADFPGKLPKQAYGLPLNDADCEGRRQVCLRRDRAHPTALCGLHPSSRFY